MTSVPPLQSQSEVPLSPKQTLPTMYDLPDENPEEVYLPDEYHGYQPQILQETFKPSNVDPQEIFVASDLHLYYDVHHTSWYKRPDWFAVVGVSRLYEGYDLRRSYVIWQEQVSPFVVVELLSPSTEDEDLGRTLSQAGKPPTKWQVYEKILRVPYYIIFSRYTNELQPFQLVGGHYESMTSAEGRFAIPELGLTFGLWQGTYKGANRVWLRFFTAEGELILTPEEEAVQAKQEAAEAQQQAAEAQQQAVEAQQQAAEAQQQAAEAQQQAVEAQQRAERLAAKLRELGIDPEQLS